MLLAVWSDAVKGRYGAVDRVLKIEAQRSKLLGLDAPVRHIVGWEEEVIELIRNEQVTQEEVREELGDELARELFESAGLAFAEVGEAEEAGEDQLAD